MGLDAAVTMQFQLETRGDRISSGDMWPRTLLLLAGLLLRHEAACVRIVRPMSAVHLLRIHLLLVHLLRIHRLLRVRVAVRSLLRSKQLLLRQHQLA